MTNRHGASLRVQIARALLCVLTLVSLSVSLSADASVFQAVTLPTVALWVLGLVLLWLLYGAWLTLKRPFRGVLYWVLAALFAGVMTLGQSFASVGTAELLGANPLFTLLFFVGRVPLYFAVMRLVSNALTAAAPWQPQRLTLWFGGALLVCWLPYFVMLFPGTLSNDSITQIRELLGVVPLANGNPIFQTFLIDVFRRIGALLGGLDAGIALYCCLQALLMAWLIATFLREMAHSGAPKWLVFASLAFYALCPVFPVFAFCVGKDTNFAMAVLFFSLEVWRLIRTPQGERVRTINVVKLCIAAALCALLRNPGVYLAALTLVLLLVWALIRTVRHGAHRLWLAPTCALASVCAVYVALHMLIIPSLAIEPMPETENYSVVLQQVARVAASSELTDDEAAAIDGVLVLDELKSAYNGELSDPIKFLWRGDATDAQRATFFSTWLTLLRKHPATCFSATFHNTYGYLYPGYMSAIKPTLIVGNQATRTSNLTGLLPYTVNPGSEALSAFLNTLATNPLYRIIVSPGLYGWVCLFATCCLLTKGREKRRLLAAVPALFTLAGCMLSAVNGYFRYAMPLYICAPFLLWMCVKKRNEQA